MTPDREGEVVVVADFGEGGPRGRALVEAARDAGASWVVVEIGEDATPLRAVVRAAASAGVGLLVRLRDTRAIADLEEAVGDALGPRTVAGLRDRILFVVSSERAGKRLRADAPWAPSAVDFGGIGGGLLGVLRKVAPNHVRGACACDDVVVPAAMFEGARLARLVADLRLRGGRVWVSAGPDASGAVRRGPAHGVVLLRGEPGA